MANLLVARTPQSISRTRYRLTALLRAPSARSGVLEQDRRQHAVMRVTIGLAFREGYMTMVLGLPLRRCGMTRAGLTRDTGGIGVCFISERAPEINCRSSSLHLTL